MEQAREYWGARRPPQPDDQDPRHRRGPPGDRADDLRGPQHQRHAAVQGRAVREVAEAYIRGLERRHEEGKSLDVALGRVVLRLARRHRGRQAPRGARRHEELAGHGRRRQRPRRLPALPGDLPRRALRGAAAPPARRVQRPLWASTGVKNPAYPDTMYVDGLVGARDRQHDADGDAAGRRRAQRGPPRRRPTSDPSRGPRGAGRRRHRPRRRHRQAAARRRRRVRRRRWRSCWRASSPSARRSSRARPPTIERVAPRRRCEPAIAARLAQAVDERRRAPDLEQGRHALGPGRPARGRQPARLADDRRRGCSTRSTT